ncbi:MAG: hypothetical protein PWR01_3588 [Clostridiales bacterium]|jgi:methyl-accepting chemotaxis protein|nr:hypothetical protein [Clostridiales bacterium]MDN5282515.1 hypothetical protein [Candidatus Ozemobacter sp.]
MRLAKGIIIGAWLLVCINLLMAFGTIGVFSRMSPAIADIIHKNERSLQACSQMLSSLARLNLPSIDRKLLQKEFLEALGRAKANVTETDEPIFIEKITKNQNKAFNQDGKAFTDIVSAIEGLAEINRQAMAVADKNAQRLGNSGAWGVVFMALCSFTAGIVFIKSLKQKILEPIEEIKTVFIAHLNGETKRRCYAANLPPEMKAIFNNINSILDSIQIDSFESVRKEQNPPESVK